MVSIAEPFNYRIFERKWRLEEDTSGSTPGMPCLSVEQKPKTSQSRFCLWRCGKEILLSSRAEPVARFVPASVGSITEQFCKCLLRGGVGWFHVGRGVKLSLNVKKPHQNLPEARFFCFSQKTDEKQKRTIKTVPICTSKSYWKAP